jgi:hypothetical protein
MRTKRFLLAVCAMLFVATLAGCRHNRCCRRETASFAGPECCPPTAPPAFIPPVP